MGGSFFFSAVLFRGKISTWSSQARHAQIGSCHGRHPGRHYKHVLYSTHLALRISEVGDKVLQSSCLGRHGRSSRWFYIFCWAFACWRRCWRLLLGFWVSTVLVWHECRHSLHCELLYTHSTVPYGTSTRNAREKPSALPAKEAALREPMILWSLVCVNHVLGIRVHFSVWTDRKRQESIGW